MTKEELDEELRKFQGGGYRDGAKLENMIRVMCLLLFEIKERLDNGVETYTNSDS